MTLFWGPGQPGLKPIFRYDIFEKILLFERILVTYIRPCNLNLMYLEINMCNTTVLHILKWSIQDKFLS